MAGATQPRPAPPRHGSNRASEDTTVRQIKVNNFYSLAYSFGKFCDDPSYIEAAGIREGGKTPLFRSAVGRTGTLTAKAMNRIDAWRMIQRRAAELGTRARIGCHTFRATGITAYLEAGGTLENAQAMAAHESPRTTKLYDRTGDEITLDEFERIAI